MYHGYNPEMDRNLVTSIRFEYSYEDKNGQVQEKTIDTANIKNEKEGEFFMEESKRVFEVILDGGTEIKEVSEAEADEIIEISQRWHGHWSIERKNRITHTLIASRDGISGLEDDQDENEVLAVKIDGEWWDWV